MINYLRLGDFEDKLDKIEIIYILIGWFNFIIGWKKFMYKGGVFLVYFRVESVKKYIFWGINKFELCL